MARRPLSRKEKAIVGLIWYIRMWDMIMLIFCYYMITILEKMKIPRKKNTHSAERTLTEGIINLNEFLNSDLSCIDQLRMDKFTFEVLCGLIRSHGLLNESKNMVLEERVAIFLNILAHDQKQRMLVRRLKRSKETISRNFRQVLRAVLRLYKHLIKPPQPIGEYCNDARWKWFKDCLGALDGTHIKLKVPLHEKPKYRTRKGEITTNVLAACTKDMQFTYVLPGWEGSAADSRVLQDALRRRHAFEVPRGYYYLVDAGFTNGEGFLAPFRGQRYHLNEWKDGRQPTNSMEFFNMKHSSARNVIERCFGLLKMRWAILRNSSFYCADTHTDIISACSLIHNLIRQEMSCDSMEHLLDTEYGRQFMNNDHDYIDIIETSSSWTQWREKLATEMYDSWRLRRPFSARTMTEIEVSSDKIGHRRWTMEEDKMLVDLLLSMHVDGKWKAEGGFRGGYLVHLEKLFVEKMPQAGFRSSNIDSRLGYLKRQFNALLEIKVKGSGFGWDDSMKMITGDRKIFNDWCKSHKDAKGLFQKPFPCFDAMEEIYSKDRATGVKGSMALDRDDQDTSKGMIETAQQDDQIDEISAEGSGSSKRSADDESSKKPGKKKMRKNKEIHNMQKSFEHLMGAVMENSNTQIAKLTAMLEAPKNFKVGLRKELGEVEGILTANILSLCKKMDEDEVAIFRDLTDEDEKYEFLAMILRSG